MDKKFAAAAGATVTSIAFQLSTVIWPDRIKGHREIVWGLWIAAIACWVWWAIAHYLALKRGETTNIAPSPSVHAPINVHVNPVFNNSNNAPTPEVLLFPPSRTSPIEHEPNVSITSLHRGLVSGSNRIFNVDSNGLSSLTALIENRESDVGVGVARNLVGIVRFSFNDRQIDSIQKGYWVGRSENSVDLDIGESCELLIGQMLQGTWLYYDNRQNGLPARLSRGKLRDIVNSTQTNPIVPKMISGFKAPMNVTINIVSLDARRTLASRSFQIHPDPKGADFMLWLFPYEA